LKNISQGTHALSNYGQITLKTHRKHKIVSIDPAQWYTDTRTIIIISLIAHHVKVARIRGKNVTLLFFPKKNIMQNVCHFQSCPHTQWIAQLCQRKNKAQEQ